MSKIHPYGDLRYAACFAQSDRPYFVEAWGTSILLRPIAGTAHIDAYGLYPLTPFRSDPDLAAGLADLKALGAVSVVLVADPFFSPPEEQLAAAFSLCRPFKRHYVRRFDGSVLHFAHKHRREVRIAFERLEIKLIDCNASLEIMADLYANLIERNGITGLQAFDRAFFECHREIDGLSAIGAFVEDTPVSMMLFVEHDGYVYAHLAGTSDAGRAARAHYGIFAHAMDVFSDHIALDIGGGPGLDENPDHPIAYVKRGLTNEVMWVQLLGAVLDERVYAELTGTITTPYFPAYRFKSKA